MTKPGLKDIMRSYRVLPRILQNLPSSRG